MKNTVFIHTNDKQIAGAIVSAHSLKRNSRKPDSFDVKIIRAGDHDFFKDYEGKKFLRAGGWRVWRNDDLQSFTPTRFMPPELMGYKGRSVVVDPDVFAVGDVTELLERDMSGHAVMAKHRKGHNKRKDYIASSVMLLDNAKLKHWNVKKQFSDMFEGKLDYEDWITLAKEPAGSIGFLESEWNDFDQLTAKTKMLHNTKRLRQPWKTGLPIDFTNRLPWYLGFWPDNGWRRKGKYERHKDPLQEALFFAYVRECLENGSLTEDMLKREMALNHVRHDAPELVKSVPSVDQILNEIAQKQVA